MLGEKLALSNINSLRSFEVVDEEETGGPYWEVKLGRLDSLTASQEDSDNIMPSPTSNATTLITLFQRFNLTVKDLVALSRSHSIGSEKPDPTIDPGFKAELDKQCPLDVDQNKTLNLDSTPFVFDNQYFKNSEQSI
ncbi:gaiacol peroxidase [Medicago truncatula]|uniref:peroxidase n=1 Tax=Medicago truncatula TaxID=3880 RepID=G7JKV0_MEDTR|nr:gaiacol peroxidase [Medicago truncatula]